MNAAPNRDRYDTTALALHWLVAALIVAAWVVSLIFEGMPRGPEKGAVIGLHKSLGLTIFALVLVRLVWRRISPPPQPIGMSPLARRASAIGHSALYVLMLAVPVAGLMLSWAEGRPVVFWGLFELPSLIGPDKTLAERLEGGHALFGNALVFIAGLHAAIALFHHYVLKDGLLARMIPLGSSRSS